MGIIKEKTETAVVDRSANNSDSDSPPLLLSNSDNNPLLPEELEHSSLLPLDEERPKQQPLASTSDVHFPNQRRGRKPSTKRPRSNTNSNRKRNKINTEAKAEAHAEIVEALNSEKNQTTLSQFQLTAPVVQKLEGLQSRNKRGKKG